MHGTVTDNFLLSILMNTPLLTPFYRWRNKFWLFWQFENWKRKNLNRRDSTMQLPSTSLIFFPPSTRVGGLRLKAQLLNLSGGLVSWNRMVFASVISLSVLQAYDVVWWCLEERTWVWYGYFSLKLMNSSLIPSTLSPLCRDWLFTK